MSWAARTPSQGAAIGRWPDIFIPRLSLIAMQSLHSEQQCLVVWAFVLTMMSTGHTLSEGGAGAESGPSKKKREREKDTAAAHEATSSGNEHSNALAETMWGASN